MARPFKRRPVHPALVLAGALVLYVVWGATQFSTLLTPMATDTIRQLGAVTMSAGFACAAVGLFFEERYSDARLGDIFMGVIGFCVGALAVADSFAPSGGELLIFVGCLSMLGMAAFVLGIGALMPTREPVRF